MKFGSRIKRRRQKLNLSQGQVANRLHVSSKTVSHWENGNSYPDIGALIQLSDYFQIPLGSLIKEDSGMKEYLKRSEVKKSIGLPLNGSLIIFLLTVYIALAGLGHVLTSTSAFIFIIILALLNFFIILPLAGLQKKYSLYSKLEQKETNSVDTLFGVVVILLGFPIYFTFSKWLGGVLFIIGISFIITVVLDLWNKSQEKSHRKK